MNFKHTKNILSGTDGINKILSASWSNNNMRLAIAQSDKKINLYDESGELKTVIPTKGGKVKRRYLIFRVTKTT